jgi:hypothetical protein
VALAAAQNREISTVDYIEFIELAQSPTEMIKGLKHSVEKKERQVMEAQKIASESQMQHDASLAEQKAMNDAAILQLKENSANWRESMKSMKEDMDILKALLQNAPAISPLMPMLEAQTAQIEGGGQGQPPPPQEQQQPQQ